MINWFNHCYPYTNFHELNLDWVIYTVKKGEKDIKDFIGLNTIKYADPILWDITRQYEANTVVVDPTTGNAFISVKAVPYGTHINNTDYWTQIYNYADVVDTLREQIASNEGLSTTATKPYSVDDLVFTNNLLYRVISPMIAGDSFVVDSNVVKTTIDEELKLIRSALDTLQDNIDAEALARETADGVLQDNIDAEALARETADGVLQDNIDANTTKIGDLNNLTTQDKTNLVNAINESINLSGIYNNSTPTSGLTTNIGLKEGNYTISSNTTINAQLVVPRGAIITVNSGVTLTINGQILAGRYTIFSGNGNVVIKGNYNEVYPEWFGAVVENSNIDCGVAINKAINASTGGIVSFAPNVYWIQTPIVCNKVMTLRGVRDKTYITAGMTTVSPIITITGSGSTYVDGATIEDMNIGRYSNLANSNALYITRCANTLIRNLRLINCNYGIRYKFTTSTRTEGCISLTALEQSQFFGYLLDCTEAPPLSGTSANGSCYFINCAVNVSAQPTGTCEGFYAGGRDVRDLYFINCETALTKNGINIDCTGSDKMATDINITNCVLDRCQNHGIRVYGVPSLDGGVKISNTFISLDPQSATPEQGIIIDESWNVFLNNNEIYCNATNATGLYLRNTHGCTVNNMLFNACGAAMVTQASSVNAYSNLTCRAQTQQATGIILGDSRSVVNNLLFLAYTTGLSVTGNNNVVVGINRSSTVTTAYSDTGSNNQIAYVN